MSSRVLSVTGACFLALFRKNFDILYNLPSGADIIDEYLCYSPHKNTQKGRIMSSSFDFRRSLAEGAMLSLPSIMDMTPFGVLEVNGEAILSVFKDSMKTVALSPMDNAQGGSIFKISGPAQDEQLEALMEAIMEFTLVSNALSDDTEFVFEELSSRMPIT